MAVRCGLKFHVICVAVGDQVHPLQYLNHWGLDVRSREEVDQARRLALEHQQRYGMGKVTDAVDQHSDIFDFGDVFTTSLPAAA